MNSGETHALTAPTGPEMRRLVRRRKPSKNTVTSGSITLDGQNTLAMSIDERARAGLFL